MKRSTRNRVTTVTCIMERSTLVTEVGENSWEVRMKYSMAKKRRTSRMTKAAMKRGPFLLGVSIVLACFLAFRDKEIEVILRGDPDVQKDRSARSERLCLLPVDGQLRAAGGAAAQSHLLLRPDVERFSLVLDSIPDGFPVGKGMDPGFLDEHHFAAKSFYLLNQRHRFQGGIPLRD